MVTTQISKLTMLSTMIPKCIDTVNVSRVGELAFCHWSSASQTMADISTRLYYLLLPSIKKQNLLNPALHNHMLYF